MNKSYRNFMFSWMKPSYARGTIKELAEIFIDKAGKNNVVKKFDKALKNKNI